MEDGYERKRFLRAFLISLSLHAVLGVSMFLLPSRSSRFGKTDISYGVELVSAESLKGSELPSLTAQEAPSPVKIAEPPPIKPEPKRTAKKPAEKKAVKPLEEEKLAKLEELKMVRQPKPLPPELQKQKVEEKKKADPEPEERERKLTQTLEQLRERIQAKEVQRERTEERTEKEKKISQAVERLRTTVTEKGPLRSEGEGTGPGKNPRGTTGGTVLKGPEFIKYYSLIHGVFKENWVWPPGRSDLKVTVHFGIQDNGEIVGLKIVQSSGDASYDDSVFRAIRKASPLPPPPENYRKDFRDVELTFRPKDLGA